MRTTTLLLLGIALGRPAAAVSEAACLWMCISPSTRASGMGNTFSPLSNDPFNAWFAPGSEVLRPEGQGPDLQSTGYPGGGVGWLRPFSSDIELQNQSLLWRGDLAEGDWQVSAGYLRFHIDEGERTYTDQEANVLGTFDNKETSHSLRLGLGRRQERWSLGLGLGVDHVVSDVGAGILVGAEETEVGRSTTGDLGVNLQIKPLPRLYVDPAAPSAGQLDWDLGLQYSKLFFGPKMTYVEDRIGDPMPFHDRLALASRWRLALPATGLLPELPVLEAHVALERSISLVSTTFHSTVIGIQDDQPGGHYDDENDPLDDNRWDKNNYAFDERLLAGGSPAVQRSHGWELGVLGSFYVRGGAYRDRDGHIDETTRGWGVSSTGFCNWMLRGRPELAAKPLGRMLKRLELRWDEARTTSDSPRNGTHYRELGLRMTL